MAYLALYRIGTWRFDEVVGQEQTDALRNGFINRSSCLPFSDLGVLGRPATKIVANS